MGLGFIASGVSDVPVLFMMEDWKGDSPVPMLILILLLTPPGEMPVIWFVIDGKGLVGLVPKLTYGFVVVKGEAIAAG